MSQCKTIMTQDEMARTIERLAYEILERGNDESLALIGIQRRGVQLAERLKRIVDNRRAAPAPLGKLDINLYRDDWSRMSVQPAIGQSEIPFAIDGRKILLVDDVLYTGRTTRAALEAILDYGRPASVELLVLVDRGHRELPIHADYVGKIVPTSRRELVNVFITELDGRDEVCLNA